jgi:hypothetical protein
MVAPVAAVKGQASGPVKVDCYFLNGGTSISVNYGEKTPLIGTGIKFDSARGLPRGIVPGRTYYVVSRNSGSFKISNTLTGPIITWTLPRSVTSVHTAFQETVAPVARPEIGCEFLNGLSYLTVNTGNTPPEVGTPIRFLSSTNLPSPVKAGVTYYVAWRSYDLFKVAVSPGGEIVTWSIPEPVHAYFVKV